MNFKRLVEISTPRKLTLHVLQNGQEFFVLQNAQEFQSAHVYNNLSNFQKADGVAVMTGQLSQ